MQSGGHYPPLINSAGRLPFRILSLEPGGESDDIVCQLHVAGLTHSGPNESQPLYDAVSHAWGPESPVFTIRLGAWPVNVRQGLFRFLKQVRHPNESRSLWIDMLCIDQRNVQERNRQVLIMDKIYSNARRSLVWLGLADEESIIAMDLMQQVCDMPSKMGRVNETEQAALLKWAHRPYWTRTWVVQEFLLARDVLVICGSATIGWSALMNFLRHVSGRTPANLLPFLESPAYHLMRQKISSTVTRLPLKRLLVENQDTHCKDPHDKVYAMLGLTLQDGLNQRLIPRYDKTLAQLLLKTIEHCEIPAKEIPRYVKFLSTLLSCFPGQGGLPASITSTQRQSLVAFKIGRIVAVFPDDHLQSGSQGGVEDAEISAQLSLVDVHGLRSYLVFFRSIQAASSTGKGITPDSSLKTVRILTSDCRRSELIFGVAYGDVGVGDHVESFLGHEVAMVMRCDDRNAFLSGCAIGARATQEESKDPLTRLRTKYWQLQTDADVRDRNRVSSYSLETPNMLNFGLRV